MNLFPITLIDMVKVYGNHLVAKEYYNLKMISQFIKDCKRSAT